MNNTKTSDAVCLAKQYFEQQARLGVEEWYLSPRTRKAEIPQTLDAVYRETKDCRRCPLCETRNNFVFGAGNENADIMFIGEAPGRDEDLQGEPFIGRAGQLLTKIIEAIQFRREDVYIGNILKCRPPQNRDPLPEEVDHCLPILDAQLKCIRPSIICVLGRIAAQTLLRTSTPLGRLRGRIHDFHGIKMIVTYHPAALLRNPNLKRPTWEDMQMMRKEYDRGT